MSTSTRDRYRITIRDFTNFFEDKNTSLVDITPATIAKYKIVLHKAVVAAVPWRGWYILRLLTAAFIRNSYRSDSHERQID